MKPDLLTRLRCPRCGEMALQLARGQTRVIAYASGPVEEVESGEVACGGCGASYPVAAYVLSFDALLAPGVRSDGAYWGKFYAEHAAQGTLGFMDTQHPTAPFLHFGVTETLPMGEGERGGTHIELAEHPLVRPGGRVLDVGCGAGWSSLFLARRGFDVVAFDPALELMRLAKGHAIASGVFVEYICGDMASVTLADGSLDAVFALHALHHVPDVAGGVASIHRMLRVGGCLALDDHFQDIWGPSLLRGGMLIEANETIFPRYRQSAAAQPPLPEDSENEGVGLGQVLPAVERYLHVDTIRFRHVCFDMLPSLLYLKQGRSPAALEAAAGVVELLYKALERTSPDEVEYVTLVAEKRETLPDSPRHAPGPRSEVMHLKAAVRQQEEELRRLHAIVAEKDAHIGRLERLVERISNGRVMRLLGWATGRRS